MPTEVRSALTVFGLPKGHGDMAVQLDWSPSGHVALLKVANGVENNSTPYAHVHFIGRKKSWLNGLQLKSCVYKAAKFKYPCVKYSER